MRRREMPKVYNSGQEKILVISLSSIMNICFASYAAISDP